MSQIEIRVPDIGGAEDVDLIEILVKPGDTVTAEDPIATLEGDKASMEVPSPADGIVASIKAKVGDKVSQGSLLMTFEATGTELSADDTPCTSDTASAPVANSTVALQALIVPDIGGSDAVDVIEVHVSAGDEIEQDAPLVTLESDKASMEVPSEFAGTLDSLSVKVGDKLSMGDVIGQIRLADGAVAVTAAATESTASVEPEAAEQAVEPVAAPTSQRGEVYAGPAVRRLARELDIDLRLVSATGAKGRVTKADVKGYLTRTSGAGVSGPSFAAAPVIDFSKFGSVTTEPLSKIQKLSGANLHRNWVSIPHVTQFGEANITELEAFRQQQKAAAITAGVKLTPIAFIMKAVVAALQAFPRFNASLNADGTELVLKQYFHIGVAVDTPQGLVVPVIRDVDQKGLYDLARELGEISQKARTKGLGLSDMQGGCFTISSLGGIGGTAFTPIINAPEVAILGVSKSQVKPVYGSDQQLQPQLTLPLSLSYDHRVIDGAEGARFMVYLSDRLADIRTLLL